MFCISFSAESQTSSDPLDAAETKEVDEFMATAAGFAGASLSDSKVSDLSSDETAASLIMLVNPCQNLVFYPNSR